ncbi:alpha/beta hydrolase [Natrarchaeobaculum aegyptiacum]|uniref:Alpha/beta hydrolase n=1 Tax=Natrarchaeobaculum aegyptiacum TaxID=745377 RepID=A0A2Z2HSF0_9EURY|nr:alpha/beta hydrolase [Natrarchaeobaculum aegyptiacum]ARS90151.1 alpha/beta hydrolase [Natrarchaeobaculum aegyptiacum]
MSDVLIPGGRDVRGTLEEPAGGDESDTEAIVVACPPHPQHGGSRTDGRLVAVADALTDAGIACLRFDYGPWDEGHGERADVRNALAWAAEEYDRVGLFGYSFGATLSLLAAVDVQSESGLEVAFEAVSVLAPTAQLGADDDLDAHAALAELDRPLQVCHGERDTTVDWEPIVERARDRGAEIHPLPADHFFLGTQPEIADAVRDFFEGHLLE